MMAVDVDDRILRAWDRVLVDHERGAGRVFLDGQRRFAGATLTAALCFGYGREESNQGADHGDRR